MKGFQFYSPVALHIGRRCIYESKDLIEKYGKRCFILTSQFAPGYENVALNDLCSVLDEVGTEYVVWDDVEENPSVECVRGVTDAMLDFRPDYIAAIGGGSALDTAKAANILIAYPKGCDAYKVFFDGPQAPPGSKSTGKLRLLGIPTTAGSGSEVAGYAVLTRNDMHTKIRMNQISFFTDAFLDARYIEHSPDWLIDAGALDALAHGLESRMNVNSSLADIILSNFGFQMFASCRERLESRTLTASDYDNLMLAASLQGMAVVHSSTTLPHGMGYALTHEKELTHGLASCVYLAEYLKTIKEPVHKASVQQMLSTCGFRDLDELGQFLATVIRRNIDFTVSPQEATQWASEFYRSGGRLSRNCEPVTEEEVHKIYFRSLELLGVLAAE